MVEIARQSQSYTLVAPSAFNQSFKVLRDLGATASPTRTDLRQQSNDIRQFANNLAGLTEATNRFEQARGLKNSEDLSRSILDAARAASDRVLTVSAQNNQREDKLLRNRAAAPGAAIVGLLSRSGRESEDEVDVIGAIASATSGRGVKKPAPLQVTVTDVKGPAYGQDVFERGIQPSLGAGGGATLEVRRRALEGTLFDVPLEADVAGSPTIRVARATDAGAHSADNDGFIVKATTGVQATTAIYDTRDANDEDTRFSSIEHRFGAGSDVLFVAGNNDTDADGGAGDDILIAEGNSTLRGGEGNDLVAGRYAFGDAGNDLVFSSGLGSGGAGDDVVVLFAVDAEDSPQRLVGFGGDGNDTLIGNDEASVDGGAGDDRIVLRAGGEAAGGEGDDTITAIGAALVDGGAGNDDILVGLAIDPKEGGLVRVDAGAGDDRIEADAYAEITLGKGTDTAVLNFGGLVRFAKGDGNDRVTISSDRPAGATGAPKVNTAVFADLSVADVTINVLGFEVSVSINGTTDKLLLVQDAIDKPLELRFEKNGMSQTVTVLNTLQTVGPLVPIPPAA